MRVKLVIKGLLVYVKENSSSDSFKLSGAKTRIKLLKALRSTVFFGFFTTRELEDLGDSLGYGWDWLVLICPEAYGIYHNKKVLPS